MDQEWISRRHIGGWEAQGRDAGSGSLVHGDVLNNEQGQSILASWTNGMASCLVQSATPRASVIPWSRLSWSSWSKMLRIRDARLLWHPSRLARLLLRGDVGSMLVSSSLLDVFLELTLQDKLKVTSQFGCLLLDNKDCGFAARPE